MLSFFFEGELPGVDDVPIAHRDFTVSFLSRILDLGYILVFHRASVEQTVCIPKPQASDQAVTIDPWFGSLSTTYTL